MSKKLTKKQLTKANKVVGGRAAYGVGIKTGAGHVVGRHNSRGGHSVVIITTKKATKKGAKGQVVVP